MYNAPRVRGLPGLRAYVYPGPCRLAGLQACRSLAYRSLVVPGPTAYTTRALCLGLARPMAHGHNEGQPCMTLDDMNAFFMRTSYDLR
jgi:hypothetical protein